MWRLFTFGEAGRKKRLKTGNPGLEFTNDTYRNQSRIEEG